MVQIPIPPTWVKECGKEILYVNYKFLVHSQIVEQFKHGVQMGRARGG